MSDEKDIGAQPTERQLSFMRVITAFNVFIYRISGGRWMGSVGGMDVCTVTMTGAKTGKVRRIAMMYVPWQEGVLLVGSQGGADRNPGWTYNLKKNPEITVQFKDKTLSLKARLASAEEKAEVWPTCLKYYPLYEDYQQRTSRDIPVFICE